MRVSGPGREMRLALAIVATFAAALGSAGTAHAAVQLETSRGNVAQPYQRWTEASYVPTPNVRIVVLHRECPGHPLAHACVFDTLRPRVIYINPDRPKPAWQRPYLIMHEVGHYFDFEEMTEHFRDRFKHILGLRHPWWRLSPPQREVEPGPNTWGPPAEEFAEAYAECAVRGPEIPRRPRHAIVYRYRPTPAQHRRVCRLIGEVPIVR